MLPQPTIPRRLLVAVGAAELGWLMRGEPGRGWRHVVPSPKPRHIVEISLIEMLARRGTMVIAGGGGGIPVVRGPNGTRRVAAVIDKDLTSARMANVLGVRELVILTGISKVAVDYGTPKERCLDRVGLHEIERLYAAAQFPAGSMGPKIEAAIRFLAGGGRRAIIAHIDEAMAALAGDSGTHIGIAYD